MIMKNFFLPLFILTALINGVSAQDKEEKEGGFKPENLFTGGSVTVSFFNGTTILGASPLFGYKLADWVDAGVVFNFNYTGIRDYIEFDDKVRQTTYGGGIFTRLYPVHFLFAQAQLEHNFIKFRYTPSTSNYQPFRETHEANSLLLGAGYTQGRRRGSNTFYYLAVLFDVIKDAN